MTHSDQLETGIMLTMADKKPRKRTMTAEHKAALAVGRNESRAVKGYLEALEAHKPKRGRKRTSDSIGKRLAAIDDLLAESDPLGRIKLVQERIDLTAELASLESGVDLTELEDSFVEVAASYSERQGISYGAWREVGVPAAVLKRAGIGRSM
jgi:hypothetical protein